MAEWLKENWDVWYDHVIHPFARLDARIICHKLIREIDKTGGSRQRSEGNKLLQRIRDHLYE